MTEREVLRPSDVAAMLGVSSGRIYQLIAAGVIPATRIGGALRIPRASWEAWLQLQRRNAMAASKRAKRGARARS
jgi:excisionase family DNA binding protein